MDLPSIASEFRISSKSTSIWADDISATTYWRSDAFCETEVETRMSCTGGYHDTALEGRNLFS